MTVVFRRINELAAFGDRGRAAFPGAVPDAGDHGHLGTACAGRPPVRVPLYHADQCDDAGAGGGACLAAAEPGRLLRVVSPASSWGPADITDPLQVCAACYDAIAPLPSNRPPADNPGHCGGL